MNINVGLPSGSGFGTMSIATTSVAVSTLTLGPNSNSWVMPLPPPGIVRITNNGTSSGEAVIGPLGGTVTATTGVPIAPGNSQSFIIGGSTIAPVVISNSTAEISVEW